MVLAFRTTKGQRVFEKVKKRSVDVGLVFNEQEIASRFLGGRGLVLEG